MIATIAPHHWSAPSRPPAGAAWQYGREVLLAGARDARPAVQWELKRNCSITPRQLGAVYLSLCSLSLLIALGFLWQGAPVVLAFAGLELLLVGVAMLVYARHAGDRDVITLAGPSLAVEQHSGRRVERAEFRAEWVAVEPAAGQGSLVELSGHGQRVRVGRFLRPELRAGLAAELRRALRAVRLRSPEIEPGSELKQPR